jgi:alkanesulfonate monooxygenase SsuD/methylene tetrahydromethanopterin reductase-like flavin-dependent oxidoreductase (luciferase family)
MRFAIDLPNFGDFGDPHLLVDLAVAAESAGWDGFFLWDHLIAGPGIPVTDPWVAMAAIAVRTQRIRFGPMVTALARRRMPKLARESVALDHLSDGRLTLGVGLGSGDGSEFSALGDEGDRRRRGEILDESLAVLARLWSGEPCDFKGDHLRISAPPFLPLALQRPRIPVWVAGLWPNRKPMRRAAAWDGAFPIDRRGDLSRQLSMADMADAIAYVREQRTLDAPIDFVHAGLTSGDRSADRELVAGYADIGVDWWLEHIYPERMTVTDLRRHIDTGPPR